jgi:hypothetical protein
VIIPNSVKAIGEHAFHGCAGLTSVHIPASVTVIEDFAFFLTGIRYITVHPDNPAFASHDGILFNKDKTVLILCPEGRQGDYVIPASVAAIGERAFSNCTGLASVTIPASVVEIGADAFDNCPAYYANPPF